MSCYLGEYNLMSDSKCPFNTPIQLGRLSLPHRIFYAPLAGCSDFPFRAMSSRYRPGLHFCEMIKMEALVRGDAGTFQLLDYSNEMHPIGAQLCGSNPKLAKQSAKMIEELGFDLVDLNCGCPVDKVTKDGSGSGMLRQPERIGEVLAEMSAAIKIPVTVKIRAGWNDHEIVAPKITEIAEAAGAVAITIHGRTREQAYKGPANWDHIRESKAVARSIAVIGNGDLFSPDAVVNMWKHTNCDGGLIARGTLGHPWIVEDVLAHLNGLEPIERTPAACRQALIEHFEVLQRYHSPRRVLIDMRRIGCWYIKRSAHTRAFREQISRVSDMKQLRSLLDEFPLEHAWLSSSEPNEECSDGC